MKMQYLPRENLYFGGLEGKNRLKLIQKMKKIDAKSDSKKRMQKNQPLIIFLHFWSGFGFIWVPFWVPKIV